MEIAAPVYVEVVRESVSLFVLLIFGVFSYRLLDRVISLMDNHFGRIVLALEHMADRK